MKHFFKYILTLLALAPISLMAQTQYHVDGGIATSKKVEAKNGKYTVTLETYATGTSTYTEPVTSDIVLVLDVSGSMDEQLGTPEALASKSYTYDNYGTNTYYYKDGNNYWPVYRGTGEVNNQTYYFLYYYTTTTNTDYWGNTTTSYQKYFLYTNNNTTQTAAFEDNQIENVSDFRTSKYGNRTLLNTTRAKTSSTDVLYAGVLYKGTRMDALKASVCDFIDKLKENSDLLPSGYNNQISIVKFGLENDEPLYYNGTTNQIVYNNVSVVAGFTPVDATGAASLKAAVNGFIPGGGTGARYGLSQAKSLIGNSGLSTKSKKTVVLFTDGQPSYNDYYHPINIAKELKDQGVKVYTVGIFDVENDAIKNYMNGVSSNYPNANATNVNGANNNSGWTGTINLGSRNTDTDDGGKRNEYYFKAESAEGLSAIFATLAAASGAPTAEIGTSTQVKDMVSSSFKLPQGTTADNIAVSVWKISRDGNNWTEDEDYPMTGITATLGKSSYTEGGTTVECDAITVTGFDYSKNDTQAGDGTGNWVGTRIPVPSDLTQNFEAGRKIVISFEVEAKNGITGGDTQTNTSDSGVYVWNKDKQEYELKNAFEVPEKRLPINITITKDGLRIGESATFKVMQIPAKKQQKKDEEGNLVYETNAAGEFVLDDEGNKIPVMEIVYNALGKPVPDEKSTTATDPKDRGWKNWSKVILTNKTKTNGAVVTKALLNLDPNFVYLVIEDDWSWAYTTTGSSTWMNTSNVPVNPFTFTNKEKTGVVKHAEAVTINHFATSSTGEASEEHYKSSKVESFGQ